MIDGLIVIGTLAALVLFLVGLVGLVHVAELLSPRFARWLASEIDR